MTPLIDLTGRRFSRLVVLEGRENDHQRKARWLSVCDCGAQVTVRGQDLSRRTHSLLWMLASRGAAKVGRATLTESSGAINVGLAARSQTRSDTPHRRGAARAHLAIVTDN